MTLELRQAAGEVELLACQGARLGAWAPEQVCPQIQLLMVVCNVELRTTWFCLEESSICQGQVQGCAVFLPLHPGRSKKIALPHDILMISERQPFLWRRENVCKTDI